MKKKILFVLAAITLIASLMYGEYRYIMRNQRLFYGENNMMYSEIFGQVDAYYVSPDSEFCVSLDGGDNANVEDAFAKLGKVN